MFPFHQKDDELYRDRHRRDEEGELPRRYVDFDETIGDDVMEEDEEFREITQDVESPREPQRRILDESNPADEADKFYFQLNQNPLPIGQPYFVYFDAIIRLCVELPRTHLYERGNVLYIDVDVPQNNDQDVGDFKQTLARLLSFCYPYNHLTINVQFTLAETTGERRLSAQISNFIGQDEHGPFMRFVYDEQVFWALYDDEVWSLVTALNLASFRLMIVSRGATNQQVNYRNQQLDVHGRRFPYQLKEEWMPWSGLLKLAQIHPAVSIGFPQEHCLIHSLREATKDGSDEPFFTQSQLTLMKYKINTSNVSMKTLEEIASVSGCTIVVNFDAEGGDSRKCVKTKEHGPVVKIDLWRHEMAKHYMPHKLIPAREWRDLADQFGLHINPSTPHITLIHLVNILKQAGAFSFPTVYFPYHDYTFTSHKLREFSPLDRELVKNEAQYKLIEPGKKKKETKYDLYFADFECFVTGSRHVPFCICYENVRDEGQSYFYGVDCRDRFIEMLDSRGRDCIVYFHNLGYDGRFLITGKVDDLIMKGNAIYQMVLIREGSGGKDRRIIFRDSLALIPSRLAAFPSMFHLQATGPKEIFPYHYYNEETMYVGKLSQCGIDEKPQWSLTEHNHFKENLETLGLVGRDNETFDSKEYCLFYCKRDVAILKQGFLKFQRDCKDDFNLDCTQFLTISSLAYHYVKTTSFEKQNIFAYNGFIREWIRRAILGGRCMTRQNKKWKVDINSHDQRVFKKELVDFDACSLYPSAMKRLFIPKGKPEILRPEQLNYEYLSAHTLREQECDPTNERFISCYVVLIHVTKNNCKRDFPLIYKRGNGTLSYVNDDDAEMVVSNIYLEDLVRYHGIEFTIKEGIMWRGKKSRALSNRIQFIYNKRNELKAEGNPKETIYKLMMNSSYGKTIQKMINDDIHVMSLEEKEECQSQNAERIRMIEMIDDDHYFVNMYPSTDDLFIPIIVGCLILDMSKRIMNEVFDCCHQLNIPVFYQDTDSIHIPKDSVQALSDRFREVHGRELIGKQMGQFHSDFPPINRKDSWAIKSIFCGKKCYYDKLTNEDGDVVEHFRLKGVPQDVIVDEAQQRYGGHIDALYEYLYQGGEIKFNLLSTRDRFQYTKTFMIVNKAQFVRNIKF